jgi:hypothetical protein
MATLESFAVLWNPRGYSVARSNRLVSPAAVGAGPPSAQLCAGGSERFLTRFLLDSTEATGSERDLRESVERLERWAAPPRSLPPHVPSPNRVLTRGVRSFARNGLVSIPTVAGPGVRL